MHSVLLLVDLILHMYGWVLIISAVMSWLVAFNVINPYNSVVRTVGELLHRLTEPVLRPVRAVIRPIGGIDLSPLIILLLIFFLRNLLREFFGSI